MEMAGWQNRFDLLSQHAELMKNGRTDSDGELPNVTTLKIGAADSERAAPNNVDSYCVLCAVVKSFESHDCHLCKSCIHASSALVASSRSRILGSFRIALAMAMHYFCPPDS
ncbi:hypothetical protein JHK85_000648 [Glycine max]|nr:hypothetical protein JHK85_000648 [Glycine max]KAG5088018.1 hypothetical protein JHK86_000630 [Glycine max]